MTQDSPGASLPVAVNLIEGALEAPEPLADCWLNDPNTGEPVQPMAGSSGRAVARAIECATAIAEDGAWAASETDVRCALLTAFAEEIDRRKEQIAVCDSFATGIPLVTARLSASYLPDVARGAAGRLRAAGRVASLPGKAGPVTVFRLPWGPAAVIAPFNAPGFTAVKKAAYAIAAGCPVIVKPSEFAPHSAGLVGQAYLAAAARCAAPAGLLQVLTGDGGTGALLASDPRIRALAFTGGRAAGASIAAAAADFKALQLECSSNNPAIVLEDADLDLTATALASGLTRMNGQWCEGPGSVFVTGGRLQEVVSAVAERLKPLRIGHSSDDRTQFGPQANPAQWRRVRTEIAELEQAGATVTRPAETPALPGYFVPPALIEGVGQAAVTGDLFGPVLTFHEADSETEALALANSTRCGLAGYVFTGDHERGMRAGARMRAGEIRINGTGVSDLADDSVQSFWNGAGIGGHGNADLLEFFLGARIVGAEA